MSELNRLPRIVVGYDFSPLAELALCEAGRIAALTPGTSLHVIHIADLEHRPASLEERLKAAVELALRSIDAPRGTEVYTHLLPGDPAGEILSLADDVGANLVVLGTHGRRGMMRILLGSVAEKVMREARCPVLIMREQTYQVHPELMPEPPCPDCVAQRAESDGKSWWCALHDRPWLAPHRYSYQGGDLHPYHPDRRE
jgi:nucleotide-binding universal stress UspA family protein